jgi:hypothetical protein
MRTTRLGALAAALVPELLHLQQWKSYGGCWKNGEYKDSVTIERDTINQKRWDYPEYVMKLMSDNKRTPYIFIDGEPVVVGKFPSYEEFTTLLKAHLRDEQKQDQWARLDGQSY